MRGVEMTSGRILWLLSSLLVLTACGGGGGGDCLTPRRTLDLYQLRAIDPLALARSYGRCGGESDNSCWVPSDTENLHDRLLLR